MYDVWGMRLRYQAADDADLLCLDEDGNPIEVGAYKNPLRVDNDVRAQLPCLLVEAKRDLAAELRASEWSFLGRILRALEQELRLQVGFDDEFSRRATDLSDQLLQDPVRDLERMLNEEMSAISGFHDLKLSFEPPDLITSLKAIRMQVRESPDMPAGPADELGQGLQSALVVALVRSYQRLRHVNPILLVEEPEVYLHPQARRAFFSMLDKMTRDCQVLYSTHASEFIDITRPECIILVRKERTRGTVIVQGDPNVLAPDERTELKIAAEADEKMREVLFSRCAIACEGKAEASSIPILLRRAGADPDRSGWTILSAGSKDNLSFVIRLFRHFQIPTVAVFDEDNDKVDYTTKHKPLNAQIEGLVGGHDRCWIANPDFEQAYLIPSGDSKPRAAIRWARGLSEGEAKRIAEPLLRAIEAATKVPEEPAGNLAAA